MNSIKNKKGFTLIELLAVIIILGVLLLIAVPSISKYIENSRKNTYINSIKTMVNAVSTSVNALDLPFNIGKNEGIIVPFSEIELEKKASTKRSPYSEWNAHKSYVLVIFDGEMYKYYISAVDQTGYGIPMVYEKSLSSNSITTDKNLLSRNAISYKNIIDSAGSNTTFDTDSLTMQYVNHSGNYVKIKVGHATYNMGNIVALKDGSKWFVIDNSTIDDDRVNLVSYYSMDTNSSRYGIQSSSNPKIKFHHAQQNPANYETADIYAIANSIISATQVELVSNGIDMTEATVKMPEISDFTCTSTTCNCCFRGGEGIKFWTTSVNPINTEYIYTITSGGIGNTTTENANVGIRIVIKDLLKSNIDKVATKALN